MIHISVRVNSDITRAKIYISDISVSAVDEIQSPPTLIAAVKIRYLESLHVGKKQKIVLPDGRQTVL
jgi:hypothetical protein